jgi:preprotein translocase subunit Sss1
LLALFMQIKKYFKFLVLPEGFEPSRPSRSDRSPRFIRACRTPSAGEYLMLTSKLGAFFLRW